MAKRPLTLLPAALLVLSLSACSSGEEDESSAESSSESASSTPSEEAASESAESDPAETDPAPAETEAEADTANGEATGEDYQALTQALLEVQPPENGFESAEQANELADFPEGVSVARLNRKAQLVCIEDENRGIAITVDAKQGGSLGLVDGACNGGDKVADLVPRGPDNTKVTGDQDLAEPVVRYIEDSFGG